MSSATSRSYLQTPIANSTTSQKLTSCYELIECCNKVELMTKDVNNIDELEGARDGKTNKTIVDITFEDFSITPFNGPTASPERNLERSPLFILMEKPKRCYSRKEKVKSNFEEKFMTAIDDKNHKHLLNDPSLNEASASNQCKTGISTNYHWDEDGNDLFLCISTQEINKQITQDMALILLIFFLCLFFWLALKVCSMFGKSLQHVSPGRDKV
uniref:Uncharacterized protein n=1 Tax=Glossina austeni TaxID=7395 RepID=A0A1A9UKX2_GLOAU